MEPILDSRPRILIVDDEDVNIALLSAALQNDYALSTASDGAAALTAAASEPPDLILLDVVMPGPSGFSVCEQLKANAATAQIPVIFVTSLSEDIDEELGLKLGAVDYIHKPFSPEIVKVRVALHLRLQLMTEFLRKLLDQRTRDLEAVRQDVEAILGRG